MAVGSWCCRWLYFHESVTGYCGGCLSWYGQVGVGVSWRGEMRLVARAGRDFNGRLELKYYYRILLAQSVTLSKSRCYY